MEVEPRSATGQARTWTFLDPAGEFARAHVPVVGRLPGLAARRLWLECGMRLLG
ncbi:MAG TPA: hypothetical protein VFB06_13625 [Streptosporangiaceae bacterium]|nr:hypothetical protein [Streptosporangiaceae bacterium]